MSVSLRNIRAMIELELRRVRHDKTEIFARVIQPILWLVIYGPIMSTVKAIPTGGVPYTDYITPGLLIQSTTFVAIFYGITLVFERESGILKKLLVAPPPRYAIVIGRSMSAGVRAILQGLLLVPIALLVGVRFIPNIAYFVLALLSFVFTWGLLSGKRWAWTLTLVFAIIGILISWLSKWSVGIISVIIEVLIIYYLTRPHTKQFFGK